MSRMPAPSSRTWAAAWASLPASGSAFVSLVAYLAIQLAIFGFFGGLMAGQMNAQFGLDWPWYVWTLLSWALVLVLSLASVDIGAKVLGVLMGLELLSLLVVGLAVLFSGGGPEGFDLAASFAPSNIFVGGFAGSAGIALAFAFASYIGFEATAIYGEESKEPHKTVPRATYVAVIVITVLFALTAWAIVSGLGTSVVVDRVVELTTIDGVPLADPAQALFAVATEYVGSWLATVMSWLVISSLFAGLLAFQNSAARYFFAMGRAGVLPAKLDHVNKSGAPVWASVTTSVVTLLVIVIFIVQELDPIVNMFFWFSGMTVVAIVFVEMLVCVSVIIFFRREPLDRRPWNTIIAPALSFVALLIGEFLLTSRFGLLAGTVAEGVDPDHRRVGPEHHRVDPRDDAVRHLHPRRPHRLGPAEQGERRRGRRPRDLIGPHLAERRRRTDQRDRSARNTPARTTKAPTTCRG